MPHKTEAFKKKANKLVNFKNQIPFVLLIWCWVLVNKGIQN